MTGLMFAVKFAIRIVNVDYKSIAFLAHFILEIS